MAGEFQSKRANRLILIGLLIPCLLISVSAILAYRAEYQLADSFRWVSHTLEVERQLQRLALLLVDAETGTRGFLLSSRKDYLEPYQSATAQIPRQGALLRNLTADNAVQQENLRQLNPLVAHKLEIMAETLALQERGDHEAALTLIKTDAGRQAMDAIRARLDIMEREESRLLAIRQQSLASRARFRTGLVATLVALNIFFAAAILLLVRHLSKLRRLVTICSWSRTIEYEGEWVSFEKYLQRRFNLDASHGISPAEAEKAFGHVAHQG
jgi:CHASE3 domain sensor protein